MSKPSKQHGPKGHAKRQQILDAALKMFEESGYEKTTMRGIAERAGISLGSAYYYFKSKEQLIQGFYYRLHDLLAEREDTEADDDTWPDQP